MSTPTDRAALKGALAFVRAFEPLNGTWTLVVAAARAHLDTLPKTKMVEVKRWVAFECEDEDGDELLIVGLRAFDTEQRDAASRGQWVTFRVEVPA